MKSFKKIFIFQLVVIGVFIFNLSSAAQESDDTSNNLYLDSLESDGDFQEYIQKYPYGLLDIYLQSEYNPQNVSERILVIIDKSYYENSVLTEKLNRFSLDLAYQQFDVFTYIINRGNPNDLRQMIIDNSSNLKGVVFIGDIAVAWFQHSNDDGNGRYAEWPYDTFFGDLNGSYADNNGDYIFDAYSGDVGPEIWTSRITLKKYGESRYGTVLSRDYQFVRFLDNTHNYFRGILKYNKKGANFIHGDFDQNIDNLQCLSKIYPNNFDLFIESKFYLNSFISAINSYQYETINLLTHGSPNGLEFGIDDLFSSMVLFGYDDWEVSDFNPFSITTSFIMLDSCSACRYTYNPNEDAVNIGISFLFSRNSLCQSVVGSTKIGGITENHILYKYLSQGDYLAEAYLKWYREQYKRIMPVALSSYIEFYMSVLGGPVILGNPLIKINHNLSNYTPNTMPILPVNNMSYNVYEGDTFDLDLPTEDYDSDIISYSLGTSIQGLTLSGNKITWIPNFTQGGIIYTISLLANDGYDTYDNKINVKVINVKKTNY